MDKTGVIDLMFNDGVSESMVLRGVISLMVVPLVRTACFPVR